MTDCNQAPVHKALREALANCLINADYHGLRGVVSVKNRTSWFWQIRGMSESIYICYDEKM